MTKKEEKRKIIVNNTYVMENITRGYTYFHSFRDFPIPVRMVGDGHAVDDGRLEIYHNSEWGTICNKGFHTPRDSSVACRSIPGKRYTNGRVISTKLFRGQVPSPPKQIWLNNVHCVGAVGSEFSRCSHSGFGMHDSCSHDDDVYLRCGKWVDTYYYIIACNGNLSLNNPNKCKINFLLNSRLHSFNQV